MEGFFEKESPPHRARDSVLPMEHGFKEQRLLKYWRATACREMVFKVIRTEGEKDITPQRWGGTGEKGLSIPSHLFSLNPLKVGYPSRVYHVSGYLPPAWKAL